MPLVSCVHVGAHTTPAEPLSAVALGQQLRELAGISIVADDGVLGLSNFCSIPIFVRIAAKVRYKYI